MMRQDWTGHQTLGSGMGCWAIGGPMYTPDGRSAGWGPTNDAQSKAAIAAAYEAGVRIFDTAQAYGTGHSEALLGAVLADKPEAKIVTKVGLGIAPNSRQIVGVQTDADALRDGIEASRIRLKRDQIDLVLLHLNDLPLADAEPVFETLNSLCNEGAIAAFGWSTDYPDRATAFPHLARFRCVEHAMNLFFRAEKITDALHATDRVALIRSPLAMGLLGGRITSTTQMDPQDVRGNAQDWNDYFVDGRPNPAMTERLDGVRDILTSGGRSLAQGALAWLWARSATAIPIPGMRTPDQVADLVGAAEFGPLTTDQMASIEDLMARQDEGAPRAR